MPPNQLEFQPSGQSSTVCVDVNVNDDGVLEAPESVCLTLISTDPEFIIVENSSATSCIMIRDINCKWVSGSHVPHIYYYLCAAVIEVGFSQASYAVQEIHGSIEICLSFLGNTTIEVRLNFTTMDETATGK